MPIPKGKMTRVHVITDTSLPVIHQVSNPNNEGRQNPDSTLENITEPIEIEQFSAAEVQNDLIVKLEEEYEHHRFKADKRQDMFRRILFNRSDKVAWHKFLFHIFGTITMPFLLSIPYTLIPATNLYLHPNYWYETPLQHFPFKALVGIVYAIVWGHYTNIDYIKSTSNLFLFGLVAIVETFLVYAAMYFIWTYGYNDRIPFPKNHLLGSITLALTLITTIWFQFPWVWRKIPEFSRRLVFHVVGLVYDHVIPIGYLVIVSILNRYQNANQTAMALSLPVYCELLSWIYTKIISRCAKGDLTGTKIVGKFNVASRHTMVLCLSMATVSTTATDSTLMAIDFVVNIYLTLKIIWVHKTQPRDIETQIKLLHDLLINELVEFTGPLIFLLLFIACYFGPNYDLLEIVNHLETHDAAIEYMEVIFILFVVDLCSTVISGVILWVFCRISLLRAFVALENEFAFCFGLLASANALGVSVIPMSLLIVALQ